MQPIKKVYSKHGDAHLFHQNPSDIDGFTVSQGKIIFFPHIIKTYHGILIKLDPITIYTIIEHILDFRSRMIIISYKTPLIFLPWHHQTPL